MTKLTDFNTDLGIVTGENNVSVKATKPIAQNPTVQFSKV